ncbi:MAG: YkgJ family cysteine cluster protein [Treponema sp.]|jgi:Fe-S-cluster containining protein|nr:YkgJ family cysteine cluster protein [Treponema sp.]
MRPFRHFYQNGIRFSCTRCSACCRYESGFVFLSDDDLMRLVNALNLPRHEMESLYCTWVPSGTIDRLSLKEKPNLDCIFWDNGCSVYESRPLQCRTFPFWDSILASAGAWERVAKDCPGMGQGTFYSFDEIENMAKQGNARTLIQRRRNTGRAL